VLDADERERAMRFHHAQDRQRYISAHAGLRSILARYLRLAPERLKFVADSDHGKSKLAHARAPAFNLAHSGDLALVAVASAKFVGIDVERSRPMPDLAELARTHFTRAERAEVVHDRVLVPEAFFVVWTRKEALLKATGLGLDVDRRGVEVAASLASLRVEFGDTVVEVESFEAAPGYPAALALPWPRKVGDRRYFDSGP
jgi:4'-phosphopantetheinyl transferase